MPKCDNCHRQVPKLRGAILHKRFGQYCAGCLQAAARGAQGQSAQWHRDRDFEDHRRDMIQPLNGKGEPNQAFIQEYPEEAKEIFTEEQIKKHG